MIEFELQQERSAYYGAYTTRADMCTRGLYLPTCTGRADPSYSFQRPRRSEADILSTSRHGFAGDTSCNNHQVFATLSNRISATAIDPVGFGTNRFQQDTAAYVAARQSNYASFSVVGKCFYDNVFNDAFIPIQDAFVTSTDESTPYSGYTYRRRRAVVYSWIPFGKHFAPVVTTYDVSTYLPEYPQLSSAFVKVNYSYSDIDTVGSVTMHNTVDKTVLNASGSLSAIAPIVELLAHLTPDPTGYAAAALNLVTPVSSGYPVTALRQTDRYDQKALQQQNISAAVRRLSRAGALASSNSMLNEPSYDEWADLADYAIDACKFSDVNSIAYVRDLRSTLSELGSALSLLANPTNPKKWASLYLGLRYGTRLTVSDTLALAKSIHTTLGRAEPEWKRKFLYTRSRSFVDAPSLSIASSSHRTMNYKVYYKPDNSPLIQKLKTSLDWNLFPTLTNVWDLIPYSFVVDWFVGIDELCEELDRRAYTELIHVLGCTYSYKDEYVIPVKLSDLGFNDVDASVTVYHRHHSSAIHQSTLRLVAGHSSTINVVDGVSLILQRGRK